MTFSKEQMLAVFFLSGLDVLGFEQIKNRYLPSAYADMIRDNPWFRVQTPIGTIVVGPRKRVVEIDWGETDWRVDLAKDRYTVTSSETLIHAWELADVVRWLTALRLYATHPPAHPSSEKG